MQTKTKLNLQIDNILIAIAHAGIVYACSLFKTFVLNYVIRQFGGGEQN